MSRRRSKGGRRRSGGARGGQTQPPAAPRAAPTEGGASTDRPESAAPTAGSGDSGASSRPWRITERGGRVYLGGELSFATAARLFGQMKTHLSGDGAVVLDLQGVTRADSAGLALMLQWVDEARRRGRSIRFSGVPDSLLDIARFSNVLDLLPLER